MARPNGPVTGTSSGRISRPRLIAADRVARQPGPAEDELSVLGMRFGAAVCVWLASKNLLDAMIREMLKKARKA